jgi:hypothetical protein
MSAIDTAAAPGASSSVALPAPPVHLFVSAWLLLAVIHVAVALGGFPRLYRLMARWPTRRSARRDTSRQVADTCAAMVHARSFYFKHTWCLHSAAATVGLLRMRGLPAELVIGVRRMPFLAHAWVESDGRVVMNDRTNLLVHYRVITRC